MNKPILFIILLPLVISAPAKGQVGFGPEIGVGVSTVKFAPPTYPILYTSASVANIFSYKVGGLIDVPLDKHTYFQSGIYFSRKGAVRSFSYYRNDSFNEYVHQDLYINYFLLPLSVLYKTGFQGKGRFIFGLGAAPAYVIGGRSKLQDRQVYNDTLTNTSNNDKIVRGETIHGFDIGVTLSAGYELPTGLFFRTYYTGGVSDIGMNTEVIKNRVWGISAGYFFGKGRNINKEDNLSDKTSD